MNYTATFYDYYGYEMKEHTKTFNTFGKVKDYFIDICNNEAVPFAQIDREGQAISLSSGRAIGGECDSRRY